MLARCRWLWGYAGPGWLVPVRPQVLLVDEPTAALDRQRSQDVVALLARETKAQGVTTIVVTHDHDVLHHCDRVHEMIDGKLGAPALR